MPWPQAAEAFVCGLPPGVVPVTGGPPPALLLLLPPLAVGAVLALRWLSPRAMWAAARRLGGKLRARPVAAIAVLLPALAAAGAAVWLTLQPVGATRTAAASRPATATGDWPTFHAEPARSGAAIPPARPPSPHVLWKFRESQLLERRAMAGSPAIAGGRVLIGSDNHKLYCLDLASGQLAWTFEARWPVFSSAAVASGRVYVGEGLHEHADCRLYCLDLAGGKPLWSIQTASHTESTPTVAGGRVYFGAGEDGLYCADALSGQVLWRYREAHVDGCPLVADGRVVFGSGYGFQGVVCLAARDGKLLWRRLLPAPVWGAPSWSAGRLYVAIGNGDFNASDDKPFGEVRCLDPANGQDIWRYGGATDGVLTAVAVAGGLAVAGGRDGTCYALDAATGALRWRTAIGSPILSSPAVAAGRVLLGADDGHFRCLDLASGKLLWSVDTTGDMHILAEDPRIQSSPAVGPEGQVLFGAASGHVYCLAGSAEGAASAPASMAAAPVAPAIVETGRRSRLMWAADGLVLGLVRLLAGWTGSLGAALLLAGAVGKLVLAPLDWVQQSEALRARRIASQLRTADCGLRIAGDVAMAATRRSRDGDPGLKPLAGVLLGLLHLAVLVAVVLAIQASPVFAGRGFLWIGDLAAPDRLIRLHGRIEPANLLPVLLAVSVYAFLWATGLPRPVGAPVGHAAWALIAIVVGMLTYRWPAAVHLPALAMLWLGAAQARLLPAAPAGG